MNEDTNNYNIIKEIFKRFFAYFLSTMGILIASGLLLNFLEIQVTQRLYSSFGSFVVLFTALIGTPIHEFAHWIVCKLFGFEVVDVALLRPIKYKQDGILGYVSYYADNNSIKDIIGNFFVGIAPLLLGGLFIVIIIRLLLPELYKRADSASDEAYKSADKNKALKGALSFLKEFWKGIFSLRKWGIVKAVICLYIVTSISMHMTLSTADIMNSIKGFILLLFIYFFISIISALLKAEYVTFSIDMAVTLIMFFSIGIICDLLLLLPVCIISIL